MDGVYKKIGNKQSIYDNYDHIMIDFKVSSNKCAILAPYYSENGD